MSIRGEQETNYLLGDVGSHKGQMVLLDKTQVVFGRDESSCDFVLAQSFISKRHAVFETDESGKTRVRDLGSKLGTFVNGRPVLEEVLANGDHIGFGPGGVIAFKFCTKEEERLAPVTDSSALRVQLIAHAQMSISQKTPAKGQLVPSAVKTAFGNKSIIRLGRAPDNDIVLDAGGVSRYHASVTFKEGRGPVLADLGSTNGTYVNGEFIREPRVLNPDDLIFVGGFIVRVNGRNVQRTDLSSSHIRADSVTKAIGKKILIKDITLALFPREFVGLMGPSGCGKSTLMDALNGLRPATSGSVFLNDLDLYQHFNAVRRSIGYVPQRDILHETLTVERTLFYSAKLRLPEQTPRSEVDRVVDEVIETVGLKEQRSTQFRQLSGGQQKRLSLGIELITKPSFLFLDEPTSPLDPETTENMMLLFRNLADQGRIVVMVTHKFEKFFEMHQVAILARGGHLAFFGPPRAALDYFKCAEPADIYRRIGSTDPVELSRRYKSSQQYELYVARRMEDTRVPAGGPEKAGTIAPANSSKTNRYASLNQWWILTRRFFEIKLKDSRNTALLLLQAPIIAIILAVITGKTQNDAKALFISAIIAIWFGANNAVRDIVAESPIYVRERRFSLKIPSYVFSKFTVLSGIGLIQCLLFLGLLIAFNRLRSDDFLSLFAILYLTTLGGISTALFFSALVNSTEKAMSILPLLLIPQLLLSGFFMPIDDMYFNQTTRKPATAAEYRKYEDARLGSNNRPPLRSDVLPRTPPPDVITKTEGLGAVGPFTSIIMARWAVDGLVHAVSVSDLDARARLASTVSVSTYSLVLDRQGASVIEDSYRRRVWMDLAILGGFNAVFLGLTIWALKRKDVL